MAQSAELDSMAACRSLSLPLHCRGCGSDMVADKIAPSSPDYDRHSCLSCGNVISFESADSATAQSTGDYPENGLRKGGVMKFVISGKCSTLDSDRVEVPSKFSGYWREPSWTAQPYQKPISGFSKQR
jgi:hypothetical protein